MPARVHAILVVRPDGRTPAAHPSAAHARGPRRSRPPGRRAHDRGVRRRRGRRGGGRGIRRRVGDHGARLDDLRRGDGHGHAARHRRCRLDPRPGHRSRARGARPPGRRTGAGSVGRVRRAQARPLGRPDADRVARGQHDGASGGRSVWPTPSSTRASTTPARTCSELDIRGVLARTEAWRALGGVDRALRRRGRRPRPRACAPGSPARACCSRPPRSSPWPATASPGCRPRAPPHAGAGARSPRRTAQLHRRLAYAPAGRRAVPLARDPAGRALAHRAADRAQAAGPGAARVARRDRRRWCACRRSRGRARASAPRAPRRGRRSLRCACRSAQLREQLDDDADSSAPSRRGELRFFTGGGAWLVLGALVRVDRGVPGARCVARARRRGAAAARDGCRAAVERGRVRASAPPGSTRSGRPTRSPRSSPCSGSLWPLEPSRALVFLWLVALPLAALGGWFAATRVTDRSLLRFAGGAGWALAPTFLAALTQGRPTAVLRAPAPAVALLRGRRSPSARGSPPAPPRCCWRRWSRARRRSRPRWSSSSSARSCSRSCCVAGAGWHGWSGWSVPAALLAAPLVWHQVRSGQRVGSAGRPGPDLGGAAGRCGCGRARAPGGRHPHRRPRRLGRLPSRDARPGGCRCWPRRSRSSRSRRR